MLPAWGWRNFKWVSEGVQKCEKVCSETHDPKSQTNKATVIVVAKWFWMKSVISSKESFFFSPRNTLIFSMSETVSQDHTIEELEGEVRRWDDRGFGGGERGEWEDRSLSVLYFFLTVLKIGLLLSESQTSKRVSWDIIRNSYTFTQQHTIWMRIWMRTPFILCFVDDFSLMCANLVNRQPVMIS